ncbi:hypothetical protein [Camelimonas lactis]|uniref:Uncharacterized protein n=1 Tax=Camelimonas lactis TaxID=659006 RepID=A0A4R2GYV9_9HYPH|nr:hypothetical protein [Camelimonas lactis]TCO16285.1 hypothetical protein EV666_101540 [Camelimonas lactis]
MNKLIRAGVAALAMTLAFSPWAGAQACAFTGGNQAQCAVRCHNVSNFWEQAACALGATAPAE